jgi:tetraacyldisaccharide 4'-kinase
VIFTRATRPPDPATLATVARWNPSAPLFHAGFHVARLAEEGRAPEGPAIAVCGVARPGTFVASLAEAGIKPAELLVFRDHHRYSRSDLDRIRSAAVRTGARRVVTTGKDEVKLRGRLEVPLAVVRLQVEIAEPEFWTFLGSRVEAAGGRGAAGESAEAR